MPKRDKIGSANAKSNDDRKEAKMRQSKFTFNAFLLIVLIFSILVFFFTHFISGMADVAWHYAVNDSYEIEGTDLPIR